MRGFIIILSIVMLFGCANIIMPTGGDKDTKAPVLINITQENNMSSTEIVFTFDEYIKFNDINNNFFISPPINNTIEKKISNKSLVIDIEDGLKNHTTYHMSLNKCIKDLNEGNVLDSLSFLFSKSKKLDTANIEGVLIEAYSLNCIENAWVMIFEATRWDSVIFKEIPDYITKTNSSGKFYFQNLKNNHKYKLAALTGVDFIYNVGEKIAFNKNVISLKEDTIINLIAFEEKTKNVINDSLSFIEDSVLKKDSLNNSSLLINTVKNTRVLFELMSSNGKKRVSFFNNPPYLIKSIPAGEYTLKYIFDENNDNSWSTGDWENKKQPEKTINYPNMITIREDWDLEIEWDFNK